MIDFNTQPYNDDFNEDDRFYRILFVPSMAVQARELTQLQTILQNQISKAGDNLFKPGAMVIPGQASVDTNVGYVKVQPVFGGRVVDTYVNQLIGTTVQGTSGLQAQVQAAVPAINGDPTTLYVKYLNSGTASEKVFSDSEIITPLDSMLSDLQVQAFASGSTGVGSIASIQRGVYYINGIFSLVLAQSIVLSKYDDQPSARIGLTVIEKTVSSDDPGYEQLLDNAQGSFNYAAPGAHRYVIELQFTALDIDSTADASFIELIRVVDGVIQHKIDTTQYAQIESAMAQRTYDESGNYTVSNFPIDIREHRSNNLGAWAANTAYLLGDVVTNAGNTYVATNSATSISIAPTQTSGTAYDGPGSTGVNWNYTTTPFYNRGIYSPAQGGDATKLAIGIEPGKAYVQGYAINKIATEYVAVDKARTTLSVDNAVIPATIGQYVLVQGLYGIPPVDTYGQISLYDQEMTTPGNRAGTIVGSANVRFIEWHDGVIGNATARYKVGLFNISMNAGKIFNRNVKCIGTDGFAANVAPLTTPLIGSITSSGTSVTGVGTSFQTDLIVGDYISAFDASGNLIQALVASITGQSSLTLSAAFPSAVSGAAYARVETQLGEIDNATLVFPFPYSWIKTVRDEDNVNDTTYAVYTKMSASASAASGGICTVSFSTSNGTWASTADLDNYLFVDGSTGAVIVPTGISALGASLTATLSSASANHLIQMVGTVNKSGASLTEKSKTLVTQTITLSTAAAAQAPVISLGKADGYRITSILMATGDFNTPGAYTIDISDRYVFSNGQKRGYYDLATLTKIASFSAPTAPIQIQWQYFSHSSGDYFTVNSYPANVDYALIPSFNGISLRDAIDFRPRINDAGIAFTGTGSSAALTPKRGVDVRADFQYYLPRNSKIALMMDGSLFAIDGVPSLAPADPADPSTGMVLYALQLQPYTASPASVTSAAINNKRYTMRDVGALENRISNLEYYTSLSLLEQQTAATPVIGSNGDQLNTNGFIVDGFNGHGVGNPIDADYMCSIDMQGNVLRPFFAMKNVTLIEKNSNDAQRAASGYQVAGDVLSLPIKAHVPLITQPYGSRLENINPFAVFTFLGNVKLTPETDDWFEVNQLPDIVINVEGNYNTLLTMASKAGVLGTVWNSWQTAWTGSPVSVGQQTLHFDTGVHDRYSDAAKAVDAVYGATGSRNGYWELRNITIETTATQVGQVRTGTNTSIVQTIDMQVVDDKLVSTAVIPYIRSRNVLVQVSGLKPSTTFYPFFDSVDVSTYCTPAARLVYTPSSGTFDFKSNVGGNSNEKARLVGGNPELGLSTGDVIKGQTSGATAICVGQEWIVDTNQYALYVVNVIGNFSASESITGSISNAIGTFVSITKPAQGALPVTNFAGELYLLFNIPDNNSMKFRCGDRQFMLIDVNKADGMYTSKGTAKYSAQGILKNMQQTVNAVRNGQLVQNQVTQNQTVVQTSQRVISDTGWYDPLAESFLVEPAEGAFLTKVDVYFATKDKNLPVTLEIRDVMAGVPGQNVLPFSRVTLRASDVKISPNRVLLNGASTPAQDTPTTFVFPTPVYVQGATQYAIVLSSDSNNYSCWVSQMGDVIPGSNRAISTQPYLGSLFKSQNASTWTPSQYEDLMFTIYRAQFDTSVIGNIEMVNGALPLQQLDQDPFETKAGVTKVRVYQVSHGMPEGSRVVLSNADSSVTSGFVGAGTLTVATSSNQVTGVNTLFTQSATAGAELYSDAGQYLGVVASVQSDLKLTLSANATLALNAVGYSIAKPIGGIPVSQLYTTHVISDVRLDSYTITLPQAAPASGYFGGTNVLGTQSVQFDTLQPSVSVQSFPQTGMSYAVKTTSGKSVDSTQETPYVMDQGFTPVTIGDNNDFSSPRIIASGVNEVTTLGGNKSLTFSIQMQSSDDYLSPMIDLQRTSLIAISNKVDQPAPAVVNLTGLDDQVVVTSTGIALTTNGISTTDNAVKAALMLMNVGKSVLIQGSAADGAYTLQSIAADGSSATFLNAAFTPTSAGASITLTEQAAYVDNIAPSASTSYSKYVSNKIALASTQYPSTALRVNFSASIPLQANVRVFYKTSPVGSEVDFSTLNYTEVVPDAPLIKSQVGSGVYNEVQYTTEGLTPFDAVQVKLVMESTSSSQVPLIKNLRIVACA